MDSRFKIIFWLTVLFMTSLPLIGILRGTDPPPPDPEYGEPDRPSSLPIALPSSHSAEDIVQQEMVLIPGGEVMLGTDTGGYNEGPARSEFVDAFWIDRYEVTNVQYQEFVDATGHRKPGPPSRYAKRLAQLRGPNQPVTYVSWNDARAYCEWRGKRLPTEVEWEKAVRGIDGRLWPWGNHFDPSFANFGGHADQFEATSPVGIFPKDRSVFGVYDGAGNLMEWVDDWYVERPRIHNDHEEIVSQAADYGSYKVLRGGGYTSRGIDLRITNRSFMVPDFRDETIGFRCARSETERLNNLVSRPVEKESS